MPWHTSPGIVIGGATLRFRRQLALAVIGVSGLQDIVAGDGEDIAGIVLIGIVIGQGGKAVGIHTSIAQLFNQGGGALGGGPRRAPAKEGLAHFHRCAR